MLCYTSTAFRKTSPDPALQRQDATSVLIHFGCDLSTSTEGLDRLHHGAIWKV